MNNIKFPPTSVNFYLEVGEDFSLPGLLLEVSHTKTLHCKSLAS